MTHSALGESAAILTAIGPHAGTQGRRASLRRSHHEDHERGERDRGSRFETSRRDGAPVAGLAVAATPASADPLPGGSLDPTTIPKYQEPLVIPPAMPRTRVLNDKGKKIDYYEIAVKQFEQYILPMGWSNARHRPDHRLELRRP